MQEGKRPDISIIFPCLNEEQSVVYCLEEMLRVIKLHKLSAEVIVVDNASTDRSAELVIGFARIFPELRLVREPRRGYGFAYQAGLRQAHGAAIIMADMDGTYSLQEIPAYLEKLAAGYDLVFGNRFAKTLPLGAMSGLRYVGNRFLSSVIRVLFGVRIDDTLCGMRALSSDALQKLSLTRGGMEFGWEMIVEATRNQLQIVNIPIPYASRLGVSKLKPFRDGFRYLLYIATERLRQKSALVLKIHDAR